MVRARQSAGFTLVELIIVIVILGILSVGVTSFITNSVQGYIQTGERQRLATAALTAAERITRSLRGALPNSIRINSNCIEFIPILAASDYIDSPVGAAASVAASSFTAVGAQESADVSGRAVIYPISNSDLYNPSSASAITSATATLPSGSNQVTVSLSSSHRFPADSPTRRFYIVDSPVSYCQVGNLIRRYRGYGFSASQSTPSTGTSEVLLTSVVSGTLAFNYTPASLVRNAVVNFQFNLVEGGETITIEQEAQIRNVP